ncbi:MAG: hypothetical protein M1570_13810 [Chloroflexi bacterium]|nr:hypothetical protein [Chloroflexota bacterium]
MLKHLVPATASQAWRGSLALFVLLVGLGLSGAAAHAAPEKNPPGAPAPALASFLASDGTLHLPAGFRGSLDARGWDLVSGENEAPRFAPRKVQDRGAGNAVPQVPRFLAGSAAPRVAGDERWADNFAPNGVSGMVFTLAVDGGGSLYLGGHFIAAGATIVNHIAKWNGSGWSGLAFGFDGDVQSLVVDNGGHLYAGGLFSHLCGDSTCNPATNVPMNHMARWNGNSWVAVGNGVNGSVYALAIDDGSDLYVGGSFTHVCGNPACNSGNTPANRIARWNPSAASWSGLGNGLNSVVYALAVDSSGNVYIGGDFTNLCGDLTCVAPGNPLHYIAKWYRTPGNYGDLQGGLKGGVRALAVDGNNNVYAGGFFQFLCGNFNCTTNGTRVNYIAKWNVSGFGSWSTVGNGLTGGYGVWALTFDPTNNSLYVGGSFTGTCGDPTCGTTGLQVNHVAKWNPAGAGTWSALGKGMPEDMVRALQLKAGNLYAAGNFIIAGETGASHVAVYDGSVWSALGSGDGLNASAMCGRTTVYAIAADGQGNVYVGGTFNTAGRVVANNVAKWNGSVWTSLGYGVHGEVDALAIDSAGSLYAGGYFDFICADLMCATLGARANNIAKWNGSSWSGVGDGLNNAVEALAADSAGNLYVGGDAITRACGNSDCSSLGLWVNHIAKWDGAGWSPLGNGLNSGVYALAVDSSNNIYAGGVFDHLCGDATCGSLAAPMNRVAKWNPAGSGAWSPLGYGVNQRFVLALAVDTRNNLYVAGDFQFLCGDAACTSNGAQVNNIAKWNPTGAGSWSSLGNGSGNVVEALAIDSNNQVFVGGSFTKLCGETACSGPGTLANYIAKWNPTGAGSWSTLGSGTNDYVLSLAVRAGTLYAGGRFDRAGGKPSVVFGRYTDNYPPTVSNGAVAGNLNKPLIFSAANFPLSDAEGEPLTRIRVTSLPAHGTLAWNGTAVTVNQEIAAADLGQLVFVPAAGWAGTTSFGWNGSDGVSYAVSGVTMNITISGSSIYLPLAIR